MLIKCEDCDGEGELGCCENCSQICDRCNGSGEMEVNDSFKKCICCYKYRLLNIYNVCDDCAVKNG